MGLKVAANVLDDRLVEIFLVSHQASFELHPVVIITLHLRAMASLQTANVKALSDTVYSLIERPLEFKHRCTGLSDLFYNFIIPV